MYYICNIIFCLTLKIWYSEKEYDKEVFGELLLLNFCFIFDFL